MSGLEVTDIVTSISSAFAAGAVLFGVYQYKKDLKSKRKDIIFPLMQEFDNSQSTEIAKKMLDGFIFRYPEWEHSLEEPPYYKIENTKIFRYHDAEKVEDEGEKATRTSFDALLDFFGKLGYLVKMGLISKKEVEYFKYYINKSADSEAIGFYLSNYDFPLYNKLLEELGLTQKKPLILPE